MKVILSLGLFFIANFLNAQTHFGDTWFVGIYSYQVNFAPPVPIHDSTDYLSNTQAIFTAAKTNVCDSSGSLYLLSNGFRIYNKNGYLISGDDTLIPKEYFNYYNGVNLFAQSAVLLPMDSGIYYFITATCNDTNFNGTWQGGVGTLLPFNVLLYNRIDMNANGGQGKVIKKMQPILENKELSKTQMMACRHGNGKDWWLLKMAGDSNHVYKFLVTQDSIYNKGKFRFSYLNHNYIDHIGQMNFNSSGTRFASTAINGLGFILMADFDRCSGDISNPSVVSIPIQTYSQGSDSSSTGLCFSPHGQFLYVTTYYNILQYDLNDGTWYKVSGIDTTMAEFAGYMGCSVAADNKVYIGNWDGINKQMSVIDNPDAKGVACNFCRKCLRAKSAEGWLAGIPCMPNYQLGADTTNPNCWPVTIQEPVKQDEEWSFYPNPASQSIIIKNAIGKRKILLDALGQTVYSATKDELDVSKLGRGLYFLYCDGMTKKVLVD